MTYSFDDVCDFLEEWEQSPSAAEYHQRIEDLLTEMGPGQDGRAELLGRSGSHRIDAFRIEIDLVEAEKRLRAALEDGGPTVIDPRTNLVEELRLTGRREEYEALVRECIRAPSTLSVAGTCATLGEKLELADDLDLAHRAYTVGLKYFDPDEDVPEDVDEDTCLSGRYRVRRTRGNGMDAYDRAFEDLFPEPAGAIKDRLAVGS